MVPTGPSRRRRTWATSAALPVVATLVATTTALTPAMSTAPPLGRSQATRTGGGTVNIDTGSPPNSLDPGLGYTTTAGESDWIVYTPLLTYAHESGVAGTKLIPGLATSLPTITDGGRTYTLTLRAGLKYSDGTPVMASDFKFSIQRTLKPIGVPARSCYLSPGRGFPGRQGHVGQRHRRRRRHPTITIPFEHP